MGPDDRSPLSEAFFDLAQDWPGPYPAGVIGWLGDFFRLWWGLLYWNARKSRFRLRPARVRCPCQNPSDSGRGGETGCDAAHAWRRPERFRRVCPLLAATPDGLRCSVDTPNVRPFWGRAAAFYLGGALGLYLLVAVLAFAGLRLVGYRVSLLATAWPPDWHELRIARSDYFVAKAQRALDGHRISEAILSLEIAYHTNPANYAVGLQLAQLISIGQPDVAERLFILLMREHPAQRATTAEAWLRFLLVQGRFTDAAQLAARMTLEVPAQRPAWLHALFLTTRFAHDDGPLRELVGQQAHPLQPIDIALINSELMIREGRGLALLPGLTTPLPESAGTYGPYYQVTRLVALGRTQDALSMFEHYRAAGRLVDADAYRLQLVLFAALGRDDVLRQRLETGTINDRELELICADLVRHPDPKVLAALGPCIQRSRLPPGTATYAACTAYFVACGVAGDTERMQAAAAMLNAISGSTMTRLDAVEAFFRDRSSGRRVETILPSLPALSVDLIYALYEAYPPPAPVTSSKAVHP